MNGPAPHILLAVLGNQPKRATYVLGGKRAQSYVAPAALYTLLPEADRPDRVLALCTPEAAVASLPALRAGLGVGCPVDVVEISFEPTEDAVHACLAKLAERVPSGAELTVDVTHGPRHLAFVAYAGVLYLTGLRGVRLRAAYYGMRNGDESGPFINVRPLVELPRWFHAVRVLKDTGSAHAIADLVTAAGGEPAGQVGGALRTLAEAYVSALPIELGYLAQRFLAEHVAPLRELLDAQRLPLAGELVRDFTEVLSRQRLVQESPNRGWKPRVSLDRAELVRQARLIDDFLDRRDYPTAFGMMREWLVLWTMWSSGLAQRWLDYPNGRKPIERALHSLGDRARSGDRLPAEHLVIGPMWKHLVALRNPYAHHALDPHVTLSTEERVRNDVAAVLGAWDFLRAVPALSMALPLPTERLLVSPIGTRPGVLFTALAEAALHQVSRCLVICSAESRGAVQAACDAAGYTGPVACVEMDDPYTGVSELGPRLKEAARHLRDAGEVFVNVTGGTTLMGALAERIAGKARRLDRQVYRFALVDRRPPAAQEADPYRLGEACWLDDPPGGDGIDND